MEKKLRTSKVIMWLFIVLFIYVIYMGVNFDFTNITFMDTAIFCSCIASVGGILGAIITKYYNNSNAENIPKIQMNLYRDSMNIRLEYNEKMLQLRQQYNASEEEIYSIESESNLDELSDSVLDTAISELDEKALQSHQDVDIQSY